MEFATSSFDISFASRERGLHEFVRTRSRRALSQSRKHSLGDGPRTTCRRTPRSTLPRRTAALLAHSKRALGARRRWRALRASRHWRALGARRDWRALGARRDWRALGARHDWRALRASRPSRARRHSQPARTTSTTASRAAFCGSPKPDSQRRERRERPSLCRRRTALAAGQRLGSRSPAAKRGRPPLRDVSRAGHHESRL